MDLLTVSPRTKLEVIDKLGNNLPELQLHMIRRGDYLPRIAEATSRLVERAKSQKRLALFPQAAGLGYQKDLSTVGGSP